MTFAALIPNRGADRKLFVEWQKQRAIDMGYDFVYTIDYPPKSEAVDIYERIAAGVELARQDNVDYCSIIESDDYYHLNYLDSIKLRMTTDVELLGINCTIYYHIFSTGWRRMSHPGRSSLFCTTFKTSSFESLPKVTDDPHIDIIWWKFASEGKINHQLINDDLAIGIKHGNIFGKVGGRGHTMPYTKYDMQMKMLKGMLDPEAFEFFSVIKNMYQQSWQKGLKTI